MKQVQMDQEVKFVNEVQKPNSTDESGFVDTMCISNSTKSDTSDSGQITCDTNDEVCVQSYFYQSTREMEEIVRKKYVFKSKLGDGASATVHLVQDKVSGLNFACKVVKLSEMNDQQSMRTELDIVRNAHHKNVIQVFEIYESPACLWLIMELAYGSMESIYEKWIKSNSSKYSGKTNCFGNEAQIISIFKQLLQGLQYLHSIGVIHRDLKLDNILITGEDSNGFIVKISDFGLSAKVDISSETMKMNWNNKNFNKMTERWGNVDHFAPELINQAYGPQADVWSLGCVFYEILTNTRAIDSYEISRTGPSNVSKYSKILKYQRDFQNRSYWPHAISSNPLAKSLILGMMTVNPVRRLSVTECLNHPLFATTYINPRPHLIKQSSKNRFSSSGFMSNSNTTTSGTNNRNRSNSLLLNRH